jgi:2-dehydro-3-deoxygluconokinase
MALDIVAIGEPMVELNQTEPGGAYLPGFGGDTSNAAIAAARSGARTAYFTAVGKDVFGQSLLDLWRAEGVDVSHVIVDETAHTGIYFVTHAPTGHEFSYMRAGSAASRITPAQVPAPLLAEARVLHVSGISQAISPSAADAVFAAIDIVARAGGRVAYDTNLRLKLWPLGRARAIIHAAMACAAIALPGLDDARLLTGLEAPDAIADFYLRLGPKIVALTLGREGSLVATPQRRERIGSIPVTAVDATGAGDAFDGAFLAEYLATGDPFRAGRYANVAAALSTQGFGAVAPMPTRPTVEQALSRFAGGVG